MTDTDEGDLKWSKGPGQTLYATRAESNANENSRFSPSLAFDAPSDQGLSKFSFKLKQVGSK